MPIKINLGLESNRTSDNCGDEGNPDFDEDIIPRVIKKENEDDESNIDEEADEANIRMQGKIKLNDSQVGENHIAERNNIVYSRTKSTVQNEKSDS